MKRFVDKVRKARRKWREDSDGVTAIEFALVATPFLWVLVGTMELGMLMYFDNGMEEGVERAGRLIRTGQAQAMQLTRDDFRDKVCSRVLWEEMCKKGLKVEVHTFPDFGSVNLSPPKFDQSGNLQIDQNFSIGGPRSVVVVRTFYKWKFITPFIGGRLLGTLPDGSLMLSSTTTFRNEPF